MHKRRNISLAAGLVTAAVVGWACDRQPAAVAPEIGTPSFWEGCPAGRKFTGGGRIDPPGVGKSTFGFNVHANNDCEPIKGQLQFVHHPSKTLLHSLTVTSFSSFEEGSGECAEFGGVARVKHVQVEEWHEHDYFVKTCDNGEPGSSKAGGSDTFEITFGGPDDDPTMHGTAGGVLTGGNIQAH